MLFEHIFSFQKGNENEEFYPPRTIPCNTYGILFNDNVNERWTNVELTLNSKLCGFRIDSIEEITEFEGIAYIMKHEKSGARLFYLKTEDENKAFAITFKTPPVDNTGVFHILEHSVLCGSKKFPVKEPFVNLLKSSMQTFLNAMTFPDKTMYPVASTNEKDLLNLMDVYMDAVLNPRIYEKKAIFEQEGWHYEIENPSDPLVYNGVVFNEMKGALSDPDTILYDALCEALFPDTTYSFESGGSPQAIPDLTYESFLDNHRRHYRLDNSYIFLYGNLEIERQLSFLDENYLSVEQKPTDKPNVIALQKPVVKTNGIKEMQTAPENASLGVGYVAGEIHQRERILAVDILIDSLMGSNESPLKRALLDAQIADDVHGYLVDEQLQPVVVLQAKGIKPSARELFRKTIDETIANLAVEGIPLQRLEASLSRAEFSVRERDFGVADGVILAIQSMTGWLYDDAMATAYLHYDEIFKTMRNNLDTGYFESLMKELFLENNHYAEVEVKPVEASKIDTEENRLAKAKAQMSERDIQYTIEQAAELHRLQEEEDTPEALATLPMLKLEDIGSLPFDPPCQIKEDLPLTCLYHDIPTRGIDYVYHYFDLDCLSYDDLPYVGILMRLLGKLDTEKHSALELDSLIQTHLGSMRFFIEVYGDEHDPTIITPKFVVGVSALSENISHLAELPSEIWSSTLFSNTEKIKDMLQQSRIAMEQEFANSGHMMAMARISSYYAPASLLREQLVGIDFYRFLKDLLVNFDERSVDLSQRLTSITKRLFVRDGTVTSFTGSENDLQHFWEKGSDLNLSTCNLDRPLIVPVPSKKNEAFIVPTDVCFVAQGYDRRLLEEPYTGVWQVASRLLSYDYLWGEVRVKGGAYGAGFRADRSGGMQFYSYRDPNLDATLNCFRQSRNWIENLEIDSEVLDGYIISSVAGYDAPKKPREIARRQDTEYFGKLDFQWREKARNEVLGTTQEKITLLAPILEGVLSNDAVCIFGNRKIIESSQEALTIIDLFS